MRNICRRLTAAVVLTFTGACGNSTSLDNPGPPTAGHPAGVVQDTITVGMRPYGVAVTRRGIAVVSQLDAGTVARVDLSTRVVTTIKVGSIPTGVAALGENSAVVTNQGSESVSIVDASTNVESATVTVPHTAFRVATDPAGKTAYVTISAGSLVFVDIGSRSVTKTVPVGNYPNGIAIAGNTLYVAANDGSLTFVDATSGAVIRRLSFPAMLQDVAVQPSRNEVYVASESDSLIRVVSAVSGELTGTFAVPPVERWTGTTFGLGVTPDGQQLYATSGNRILIYDIASRALLRTITAYANFRRIAFDPTGRTAVVTDEGSGKVFVIK